MCLYMATNFCFCIKGILNLKSFLPFSLSNSESLTFATSFNSAVSLEQFSNYSKLFREGFCYLQVYMLALVIR